MPKGALPAASVDGDGDSLVGYVRDGAGLHARALALVCDCGGVSAKKNVSSGGSCAAPSRLV